MSSLRWLALPWNELTGSIPAELGDLRDLRQLDLAGNELTGAIPNALRNLGNPRMVVAGLEQPDGTDPVVGDEFHQPSRAVALPE